MLEVDRNKFISFSYIGAFIAFLIEGVVMFVIHPMYEDILVTLLVSLFLALLIIGKMAENNNRKTLGLWKFLGEFTSSKKIDYY